MKPSSVDTLIARLGAMLCLLLACINVSRAQNFSDDFTRETYSTDVSPWQVFVGNWVITNGVFLGGTNALNSYGNAYVTNSLTNCTIHAKFAFATNAYGGGLGARVNPANGAHYAAWIYPENSAGGSRALKLIKFTDWDSFSQLGSTVTLPAVPGIGTNFHTLTMVLDTNLISVYFDGNLQMSFADSPTNYYTNGGISLDMYTFTPTAYVLSVDDVIAEPINYPPAAQNDRFTLGNSGAQVVNAPGVLYNDSDPESNSLAAMLVNSPTNGTLNLAGDGSFTYTLTNGLSVYDSFAYQASDGVSTTAVATVLLTLTSGGNLFLDNFNRLTNPAALTPWTNHSGNWTITNNVMEGGTNGLFTYGSVFTGEDWTDYAVEGSFRFPVDGYGGGIGGRVNPQTGHRYAAWLYPELSDRGPNNIRIVKFQAWNAYGYNVSNNVQAIATIHLDAAVITNTWHTLKLAFQTNLISVYFDGLWLTNVGDFDVYTNPYLHGGISMDLFTLTNSYLVHADDVVVRPLVADDNYLTTEEIPLVVTSSGVLTNDTGINGVPLTAFVVGPPANGSLSLNTNGSFTYTPTASFSGVDSFTYEAREGTNSLGAAIVHITVNAANNTPPSFTASPTNTTVAEGSLLTVTNSATDSDLPAQLLSYQLLGGSGDATISAAGVITWTPGENEGPATNTLVTVVSDGVVSVTNSFAVVVTEVNVAPSFTASPTNTTVAEGSLL
ncbi:MAG: Ig-like domain-containing protein, partial [Verrucomicrobiota bacterium]